MVNKVKSATLVNGLLTSFNSIYSGGGCYLVSIHYLNGEWKEFSGLSKSDMCDMADSYFGGIRSLGLKPHVSVTFKNIPGAKIECDVSKLFDLGNIGSLTISSVPVSNMEEI